MKFKTKMTLAAAAVGMAVAGHASAMVNGNNGTLFLSVWDTSAGATFSYGQDLNATINSFLPSGVTVAAINDGPATGTMTPDAGLNLTFSTNLLASLSAAGYTGPLSNLAWNVVAADSRAGQLTQNINRLVTTSNIGTTSNGITNSGLNIVVANVAQTATIGFNGCTAVGSNCVNLDPNSVGWAGGVTFGDSLGVLLSTSTAIGGTLEMLYVTQVGNVPGNTTLASFQQFANAQNKAIWSLGTDGTLSYSIAAVPEPDSALLLGAGLIGLLGIARRRMKSA